MLEHYAAFEQDWEVFYEDDWRNKLYNNKVKGLTTHTRFDLQQREGSFIGIDNIDEVNHQQLLSDEGRQKLDFIDDDAYDRILSFFKPSFYEVASKGTRLNQKGVTVRIASSYSNQSNRVYKNWNTNIHGDFGNVFFKKKLYKYGILISNYPENHNNNTIGFTGVKIFKAGIEVYKKQETNIVNNSMYENEFQLDNAS